MRLLLDMNLSPDLCPKLAEAGHEAVHWSRVGERTASDQTIMAYAKKENFVVLTHDLDFGALLAASHASGPSVIQVRTQDLLADRFVALLIAALKQFESDLMSGALITVEEARSRARVLPIE